MIFKFLLALMLGLLVAPLSPVGLPAASLGLVHKRVVEVRPLRLSQAGRRKRAKWTDG